MSHQDIITIPTKSLRIWKMLKSIITIFLRSAKQTQKHDTRNILNSMRLKVCVKKFSEFLRKIFLTSGNYLVSSFKKTTLFILSCLKNFSS